MTTLRTAALALAALACLSFPAAGASREKLDPELAEHPYIGRLYVRSFEAGVRIPEEFRGQWSTEPRLCGSDEENEAASIFVNVLTFHYYDETHVVTKVTRIGPRSIHLSYGPMVKDYHYLNAPPVLTLSNDGQSLEGWESPGKGRYDRWKKCPPERSATGK